MKKIFLPPAALALVASVYSCRETTEIQADETAESVEYKTDNAFDHAGDAMEDAGDPIEDAAYDL